MPALLHAPLTPPTARGGGGGGGRRRGRGWGRGVAMIGAWLCPAGRRGAAGGGAG